MRAAQKIGASPLAARTPRRMCARPRVAWAAQMRGASLWAAQRMSASPLCSFQTLSCVTCPHLTCASWQAAPHGGPHHWASVLAMPAITDPCHHAVHLALHGPGALAVSAATLKVCSTVLIIGLFGPLMLQLSLLLEVVREYHLLEASASSVIAYPHPTPSSSSSAVQTACRAILDDKG